MVGHSYIKRAQKWAAGGKRAGGMWQSNTKVCWLGQSGMRWDQLLPMVARAQGRLPCPDVVVVHLGGNDLTSKGRRQLLQTMRVDLMRLADMVRPAEVVWSEVVPRFEWRGAESRAAIEASAELCNEEGV